MLHIPLPDAKHSQEPLSLDECFCLLQALRQLHATGRAHRDFKPTNIVVTGYEGTGKSLRAKLIDWTNSCHESQGKHTPSLV